MKATVYIPTSLNAALEVVFTLKNGVPAWNRDGYTEKENGIIEAYLDENNPFA